MDKIPSIPAGLPDYKHMSLTGDFAYSGKALKALLRKKSPQQRARITARLVRLNAQVYDLSATQFGRLCKANPGSVSIELGHRGKRGPRPSTVDRLLREHGAARPGDHHGNHPGDHHDGVYHLHGDDHLGDHHHHSGNGAAVPAPTGLTLELIDTPEGRQEFLKQVQLLFKALDAVRSQAERSQSTEPELPLEPVQAGTSLEPGPAAKVCCVCSKEYEGRSHYPSPLLAGPICGECNAPFARRARTRTRRASTVRAAVVAE